MRLARIGLGIVCKSGGGRDIGVKYALFTYLVKETKCGDCGAGLCWWTVEAGW